MIEKAKRVRIVLNTQLILSHPQKIFFRFHTESLHCMHCTGENPFKSEMCGKQFLITGHLTNLNALKLHSECLKQGRFEQRNLQRDAKEITVHTFSLTK